MNIVLYKPEIPPNTGNIARLCVSMEVSLTIIGKPAFDINEKSVKRAGLDYWQYLKFFSHTSWEHFLAFIPKNSNIYLISKFGQTSYTKINYQKNDYLVFGNETSGLPKEISSKHSQKHILRIPMKSEISRCLNLSNSVAIILCEALRQIEDW